MVVSVRAGPWLISQLKFRFGFVNQRFSIYYFADLTRVVSLTPKHANSV